MHRVELLGILLPPPDALLGNDAKASRLQPRDDLPGEIPLGGVGLDDR
jgi:hypothetical protein